MTFSKTFLLLLLGLLLGATHTKAQDTEQPKRGDYGFAAFQMRYLKPDFSKFNSLANGLGYSGLGEELLEYSVTFGSQERKKVPTFGFSWIPAEGKGVSRQTQYKHFMMESETLYSFLKKEKVALGVNIGLGVRWSRLIFTDADASENLGDILGTNLRQLKNFGIPIWAGLGTSFILGGDKGGFNLAISGGYRLDRIRRWKLEDAVRWDNRAVDMSGFFAAARVGFAGESKSLKNRAKSRTTRL